MAAWLGSKFIAALLTAALLAGCAGLRAPAASVAANAESLACARWFEQLDASIDRAGVRDVEADRIDGFAGLGVDRFSASAGMHWVARPRRSSHVHPAVAAEVSAG